MWKGLRDVAGCGGGGGGERSAGGGSVRAADRTPLKCATQRCGSNGFEPRAPFSNICEKTGRRRQNFAKMMRSTCTVIRAFRGESQGTSRPSAGRALRAQFDMGMASAGLQLAWHCMPSAGLRPGTACPVRPAPAFGRALRAQSGVPASAGLRPGADDLTCPVRPAPASSRALTCPIRPSPGLRPGLDLQSQSAMATCASWLVRCCTTSENCLGSY